MSDILEELYKGVQQEQEIVKIRLEKRRGSRYVTVIEGVDEKLYNHREIVSFFKNRLACGGTAKNGKIELQGDHRYKVKDMLVNLIGIPSTNIIVEE